jgi:hypothetical protein
MRRISGSAHQGLSPSMSVNICPVRDSNPQSNRGRVLSFQPYSFGLTLTGQKSAVVFGFVVANAYGDCASIGLALPATTQPTPFYRANINSKN